jgi:hypothetical protein
MDSCLFLPGNWLRKYDPKTSLSGDTLDKITIIFILFLPFPIFCLTLHYIHLPTLPIYFTSILPEKFQSSRITFWSMGLFQLYVSTSIVLVLLCYLGLSFGYLSVVVPLVTTEFKANQKQYMTYNILRKNPINLSHMYREFSILHNSAMKLLDFVILPYHSLFSQIIMFCNFSLISGLKAGKKTYIILSYALLSIFVKMLWLIILEIGGRFHTHSKKTIASWKMLKMKDKRSEKYLSKFRKSCRPLWIGTEGVFIFKRLSALKFLRAIVRGTFRIILAVRGYKKN